MYGDMGFKGIKNEDADSYERRYEEACYNQRIKNLKAMGFGSVRLGKIMDWVYASVLICFIGVLFLSFILGVADIILKALS